MSLSMVSLVPTYPLQLVSAVALIAISVLLIVAGNPLAVIGFGVSLFQFRWFVQRLRQLTGLFMQPRNVFYLSAIAILLSWLAVPNCYLTQSFDTGLERLHLDWLLG